MNIKNDNFEKEFIEWLNDKEVDEIIESMQKYMKEEKTIMENEKITISLEEYKELLMIKGKYEELKSQMIIPATIIPNDNNFEKNSIPESPYKIYCEGK